MMIAIKLWIQTPCRPDSPKTNTDHPILPARPYIVVVKPAGGKPHPGERGNKSHRHRDKPDTGTHSRERKEKEKNKSCCPAHQAKSAPPVSIRAGPRRPPKMVSDPRQRATDTSLLVASVLNPRTARIVVRIPTALPLPVR